MRNASWPYSALAPCGWYLVSLLVSWFVFFSLSYLLAHSRSLAFLRLLFVSLVRFSVLFCCRPSTSSLLLVVSMAIISVLCRIPVSFFVLCCPFLDPSVFPLLSLVLGRLSFCDLRLFSFGSLLACCVPMSWGGGCFLRGGYVMLRCLCLLSLLHMLRHRQVPPPDCIEASWCSCPLASLSGPGFVV